MYISLVEFICSLACSSFSLRQTSAMDLSAYLDYSLLWLTMVYKCSAFGCNGGYNRKGGSQSTGPKVIFHSFPIHDKDLCSKWIKANPRKDFTPSTYSKICSLHFHMSDFVSASTDSNTTRKNKKLQADSGQLSRRHESETRCRSIDFSECS